MPVISLSPMLSSVAEGSSGKSGVKILATLSSAAASTVTVNYAASDGAATAGSDYVADKGVLTFAVGETEQTFSIMVYGDTTDESNESFFVELSSPSEATLSDKEGASRATIEIVNDDAPSAPTLVGSAGSDSINGTSGNDAIDGGSGTDISVYSGNRSNFSILKTSAGYYEVTDNSGVEGVDTLMNIERIKFADTVLALDTSGNAGQAYRMYQAAFDRKPDTGGLSFWINYMDHGYTLEQVAREFINSVEFRNLYGANPTTDQFITKLYNNVLHRTPEQAGFDFWVNTVSVGATTREQALMGFSESTENQANLIGVIGNGIDYTPL